jgi:hypothetical protein
VKKALLIAAGLVALTLGAAGIAVPLLPTTPLVLLAAACFSASNKKLEAALGKSRLFGPFIENYRTGQGIGKFHKIGSIAWLWAGLITSAAVLRTVRVYIILSVAGVAVTVHLLLIKTKK